MIKIVLSKGELHPYTLMNLEALSTFRTKSQVLSTENINFFKKGDIVISKNCFFMFKEVGGIITNTIYHNEMPVSEIQFKIISNGLDYSIEILSKKLLLSFFLSEDEIKTITADSCHIYVMCMMYIKWIKIAYKRKYIHGIKKERIFSEHDKEFTLDISPANDSISEETKTYGIRATKRKWFVRSHKRRFKSGRVTYVRGYIKGKEYGNGNDNQTNLFGLIK